MIYNEIKGDLFDVGSEYYLVHCISADFKMGLGIAKTFRDLGCQEEILKEIEPLDNNLLEKISSLAYFEEFISGDLLEKAWKMPWGWGKKEDFKPILVIFGSNLDVLDGNSRIERDREAVEEILEFHKLSPLLTSDTEFHCWNLRNKTYCPKDWRDFK